jgi:hypothetical protein
MSTETSLPEWVGAFRTLSLNMTKEHSEEVDAKALDQLLAQLGETRWSYGPAFAGSFDGDDVRSWLKALHEEAAAAQEKRRKERLVSLRTRGRG